MTTVMIIKTREKITRATTRHLDLIMIITYNKLH